VLANVSTGAFLLGVYVPLVVVALLVAARSFDQAPNDHSLTHWAKSHIWRVLVWSGGAIAAVAIGASATRMLDPNDSHEVIRQRATWEGASKAFALLAVGGLVLVGVVGIAVVLLHQIRRWAIDSRLIEVLAGILAMLRAGAVSAFLCIFAGGLVLRVMRVGRGSLAWWLAYLLPVALALLLGDWSSLKHDLLVPYQAAISSRNQTRFWRATRLKTPVWGRASLDDVASAITDLHERVLQIEENQLDDRVKRAVGQHTNLGATRERSGGWSEWWASRPKLSGRPRVD
jgi:hypothetical protein